MRNEAVLVGPEGRVAEKSRGLPLTWSALQALDSPHGKATYAYHSYDEGDEVVRGSEVTVADRLEHRGPAWLWEASYRPLLVEGERAVATGTACSGLTRTW